MDRKENLYEVIEDILEWANRDHMDYYNNETTLYSKGYIKGMRDIKDIIEKSKWRN